MVSSGDSGRQIRVLITNVHIIDFMYDFSLSMGEGKSTGERESDLLANRVGVRVRKMWKQCGRERLACRRAHTSPKHSLIYSKTDLKNPSFEQSKIIFDEFMELQKKLNENEIFEQWQKKWDSIKIKHWKKRHLQLTMKSDRFCGCKVKNRCPKTQNSINKISIWQTYFSLNVMTSHFLLRLPSTDTQLTNWKSNIIADS